MIATKLDNTVVAFGVQAGALVMSPTGLTGDVIAAARDQTGVHAWIATPSGVVRARPGTTWTIDRGPIASPDPPLDAAIAADGTLWISVSDPAGPTAAYVALTTLAPTATGFAPLERVDPTSHADRISRARVVLASDGVQALVLATADAGGTPSELTPRLRTSPGVWNDAEMMPGLAEYAFVGTTLAAIVNDAASMTISWVPDLANASTAQLVPAWPAQATGVIVDGAGRPCPSVTQGDVVYLLTPSS